MTTTPPPGQFQPRRRYTCATCGGIAYRQTNIAARPGMEDPRRPLLHLNTADWIDNPHDVDPIDEGPVRAEES